MKNLNQIVEEGKAEERPVVGFWECPDQYDPSLEGKIVLGEKYLPSGRRIITAENYGDSSPSRRSGRLPKNPALRRALTAAILSAGAWADHFRSDTLVTVFPPYVPAGRRDLIPALRRRVATGRYDVTCLEVARSITE
jgi:hypothetical protein